MNQPFVPSPGKGNRRAYQNIMENLVHKEIHRQLKRLPQKLAEYIDVVEVATYALNRVPPLYASSERGKERHKKKAFWISSNKLILRCARRSPLSNGILCVLQRP